MRLPSKERLLWPALTCALIGILVLLGTLQYRWSNEVSEATKARMKAALDSSMLAFRQDLGRELSSLTLALEPAMNPGSALELDALARAASQMRKTTAHNGLVKAIYVAEQSATGKFQLLKESDAKAVFEAVEWPPELAALRQTYSQSMGGWKISFQAPPGEHGRDRRHGPDYRARPDRRPDMGFAFLGRIIVARHKPPWLFASSVPALVRPLDPLAGKLPPERVGPRRWVIVELDRGFFRQHLFPELVSRYFPGNNDPTYDVAVVSGKPEVVELYRSGVELTEKQSDAMLDLFGPGGAPGLATSMGPGFGRQIQVTASREMEPPLNVPFGLEPGHTLEESSWFLLVKNRRGSLEAAVARLRLRNLGVSFGILLVLAATMTVVLLASQRARRLAQLQMDFVAGVSHELRTPITVISSAAENIVDGLVADKQQIVRYGSAIKSHAAQLKQLVEQILLFASSRHGKQPYTLRPANVEDVIELALANCGDLIRGAGIAVEKSLQSRLPAVTVDTQALSQCLQNLIANAVKYRGDVPWIGIAAATREVAQGTEVVITISDRGIGIGDDELKNVFEPFYRTAAVREAQIHGSGLGLPLAKSMAEAMGGYITVQSRLAAGSAFSVHLPTASTEVRSGAAERATAENLIRNHE